MKQTFVQPQLAQILTRSQWMIQEAALQLQPHKLIELLSHLELIIRDATSPQPQSISIRRTSMPPEQHEIQSLTQAKQSPPKSEVFKRRSTLAGVPRMFSHFGRSVHEEQQETNEQNEDMIQNILNFPLRVHELEIKTREQKAELDTLRLKLREERQKLVDKKMKYLKQLQHLKDQLNKREKLGDGFEYFEVEYFDLTQDMTEEAKVAAELKIADMRQHFNRRMVSLRKRNLELEKMVRKYETIAALQASEMNVHTMMRKMAALTQNAQEIWDAIQRQFGSGFMTQVIKQEYDVSSGSSGAQIQHRIKSQLLRYESEAEKKLEAVTQKLGLQLGKVRSQLKQKEEEHSKLSKEVGQMIRIAKTEAYYKCDEKWRAKTEQMYRDFDEEKNDLYEQIRGMQTPVELEKTEVKMLFNRWVFVARLQRLYEEQSERDKLLRKTKEFLNKQQAQRIAALMEQLQEYKGENYTLGRRLADAQLELVAT